MNHLKEVVLTEEYHCNQGGSYVLSKPIANLCAFLLKSKLYQLEILQETENSHTRVTFDKITGKDLESLHSFVKKMLQEFEIPLYDTFVCWKTQPEPQVQTSLSQGLQMNRFFWKNRISIGHADCTFESQESQTTRILLSFSVNNAHNSVWGFGSDIFCYGTKINKSIQVKYLKDPKCPDARIEIKNRSNISAVVETIKSTIPGGVADLAKLCKAIFFARDQKIYASGDENILLSSFPDDVHHVHIVSFSSKQEFKPLTIAQSNMRMIVVGVAADNVWLPFVASTDATLEDLAKHFMKIFVGDSGDKSELRIPNFVNAVRFALRLDPRKDIGVKLNKEFLQTAPLTTKLTVIKEKLKKLDPIDKKSFEIPLGEKNADSIFEVDMVYTLDWSFMVPQTKFIKDSERTLYEQIVKRDTQKKSPFLEKVQPPETEWKGLYRCRVQTLKLLEIMPKLSNVLGELWDVESQIPGCLKNSYEDHHDSLLKMQAQYHKIAPPPENSRTEATKPGLKPGFGFFFPAIYVINVENISASIDSFADFDFHNYKHLEKEQEDYVSVRYRPIGMIFAKNMGERLIIYNVLEICDEQLETIQKFAAKTHGNLFEREYKRMVNWVSDDVTNGKDAPKQQPFDAAKITLTEIQRTRLVTYFKYHGSTFDRVTRSAKRETAQYLLKEEMQKIDTGYVHTIVYEKKPVE